MAGGVHLAVVVLVVVLMAVLVVVVLVVVAAVATIPIKMKTFESLKLVIERRSLAKKPTHTSSDRSRRCLAS